MKFVGLTTRYWIIQHYSAALLLVGIASPFPVWAGLFDDNEARRAIIALQQQNDARFQQWEVTNKKILDMVHQIEQMQQSIAQLRGKTDELNHNLQLFQKQQQSLYVDLEQRMKSFEVAKVQIQEEVEEKAITALVANVRAGKYKEAIASLQKFITEHPQSKELGIVYYWLGISQTGLKQFAAAQVSLQKSITLDPSHSHIADAMLALASVQASQDNKVAAKQTLKSLIAQHPEAIAAQQAKKALTMMR